MESNSGFEDAATKSFVSMAALYIVLLDIATEKCAKILMLLSLTVIEPLALHEVVLR
jgi:hypothetical protein